MLETREKRLAASAAGKTKGVRGIPGLPEAKKDAASCENRRGAAHTL